MDDYNYINTMKTGRNKNSSDVSDRMRFKLKSHEEDFIFQPQRRQFSFYQICQFPIDKKYAVRKLIYDETGELITYREAPFKKEVLDKFLKKSPEYKRTIYPAYELGVIGFPEANEILTARSQILNDY
jgi:hypothetical protein